MDLTIVIAIAALAILFGAVVAVAAWFDSKQKDQPPSYIWLPENAYGHENLGNGWVIFKLKINHVEYRFLARRDPTHQGRDLISRIENDR